MQFDKEKFLIWAKKNTDWSVFSVKVEQAFSGWSVHDPQMFFGKMREVLDVLEDIVNLIEKFSKEVDSLNSRDKLEGAVTFIDSLIKFNMFFEMVDGVVIRSLLSSIVLQKNKWFGKDWVKNE
jgi:hypothetical protein